MNEYFNLLVLELLRDSVEISDLDTSAISGRIFQTQYYSVSVGTRFSSGAPEKSLIFSAISDEKLREITIDISDFTQSKVYIPFKPTDFYATREPLDIIVDIPNRSELFSSRSTYQKEKIIPAFNVNFNSVQSFSHDFFKTAEVQSLQDIRSSNNDIRDFNQDEVLINIEPFLNYYHLFLNRFNIERFELGTLSTNDGLSDVYESSRQPQVDFFNAFSNEDIAFSRISKRINKVIYPSSRTIGKGRKTSFL